MNLGSESWQKTFTIIPTVADPSSTVSKTFKSLLDFMLLIDQKNQPRSTDMVCLQNRKKIAVWSISSLTKDDLIARENSS